MIAEQPYISESYESTGQDVEPLKIGLVCPYNIVLGGGVQEVVKALQDGLNDLGHEAVIITPRPRQEYEDDGRQVIFLGSGKDFDTPIGTTAQLSSASPTKIHQLLGIEGFDVLNFHEPWVPFMGGQLLRRSGAVNVATFHAKLPDNWLGRAIPKLGLPYTRPMLKNVDGFTAVSEAASEHLLEVKDVPVDIISNGIHLSDFRPSNEAEASDSETILYLGRLEERKGVNWLLQAFARLEDRNPNAELVIAGDGADRQDLEQLAIDLNVKNVDFRGFVDDDTKKQLLRSARLFCSPALYGESFGIVLLEAMASGLVTVAGNNPGYRSVMKGIGELSLVDPTDTEAFRNRLELLLYDDNVRDRWKEWAGGYVRQFDYPHIVARYLSAYQGAM